MMFTRLSAFATLVISLGVAISSCEYPPVDKPANTNPAVNHGEDSGSTRQPASAATPRTAPPDWAVTLPVLDAFLADPAFAGELKSRLELTDQQIDKLEAISRDATLKLRQNNRESSDHDSSVLELRRNADRSVREVIGKEKTGQLFLLVAERWNGENPPVSASSILPPALPTDTRIVVNEPAFRMDLFQNGQLIKSYKIGIGYPEFPLPIGLRKADRIIFNPTWTPPDEPWVRARGSKVRPGETIEAGSKQNPLGLLKIPIGLPSLIHGGKSPGQIGNFASHGCVGLTDRQVREFAQLFARLGGVELTEQQLTEYAKNRTETKTVKLDNPVPVELRYETIVVEDGKLHIYRDVYDRDTNSEENLRAVLQAYGATLDQLTDDERAQVMNGLAQMSREVSGGRGPHKSGGKVTRYVKGQKEVIIEIGALAGKGYPSAVEIDSGANPTGRTPRKRK